MSAKKTAAKKQPKAQKPAKPAKDKAAFAAKMAKARQANAEERQSGPCPKGGEHEFALDDEGDNVCSKCLEPGAKAKGRMPKTAGNAPRTATRCSSACQATCSTEPRPR
jgi:hypothetical protein